MKRKNNWINRIPVLLAIVLAVVLWSGTKTIVAYAADYEFDAEAELLPANEETYDFRITVSNDGKDWEGVVRVTYAENYGRTPTAYDTVISLPQGSEKQFDIKIPMLNVDQIDGDLNVTFLDKKGKECEDFLFRNILRQGEDSLRMGILSDNYDSLTCLDMGGASFYYYGYEYPIKLQELNQDNLLTHLDALEFLVIDTYDTSVLSEDVVDAIEKWNTSGGVLVIGTGEYAEKTLSLFEDSYLDVTTNMIYEPKQAPSYDALDYVDWSKLHIAEFWSSSEYYESYPFKMLLRSYGTGAIGILPFSLKEVVDMDYTFYKSTDSQGFLLHMFDVIASESERRYRTNNTYYNTNQLSKMLRMISKVNTNLNFGALKAIVIIYVIFVGPVLYIILRILKKREWYWVAVPITTVLGIVVVFFAGRGFEVSDTQVYSVTTQDLSGQKAEESFLYCYDAGNKEWSLELAGEYDYVAPHNSYNYNDEAYYYHITKEGDSTSIGIKPETNFEDAFFITHKKSGEETVEGTIEIHYVATLGRVQGSITNATEKDFKYFAVLMGEDMYVFEGLEAGETVDLIQKECVYSNSQYDIWYDYMNEVNNRIDDETPENISALSALGVGIASLRYNEDASAVDLSDSVIVMGVVENWDVIADGNCTEHSYGCVYVRE